jgi:hypothetical protein
MCGMTSNYEGYLYGGRIKFEFLRFFQIFWSLNDKKTTSFSIQTIKFIFKQSNLNSNRSITRCHTTGPCLQQQTLVWVVMLRMTLMRTLLPARLKLCPLSPPHRSEQTLLTAVA